MQDSESPGGPLIFGSCRRGLLFLGGWSLVSMPTPACCEGDAPLVSRWYHKPVLPMGTPPPILNGLGCPLGPMAKESRGRGAWKKRAPLAEIDPGTERTTPPGVPHMRGLYRPIPTPEP